MIYNDLAHGGGTNHNGKTNAITTPTLTNGVIEKTYVGILIYVVYI